MSTEDNLEILYHQFWNAIGEALSDGADPLEVAGILTAQAMSIYKTVLSEEDFDSMIDNISNSRDRVKRLEMDTLQ